jgi:hypothetical protein
MSDDKRDWVAEHEQREHENDEQQHEQPGQQASAEAATPAARAHGELADELRSIRAVGEDRR